MIKWSFQELKIRLEREKETSFKELQKQSIEYQKKLQEQLQEAVQKVTAHLYHLTFLSVARLIAVRLKNSPKIYSLTLLSAEGKVMRLKGNALPLMTRIAQM